MKHFLLNIIHIYWFLIPNSKRRKCIFKESCSHHVFRETKKDGFRKGLKELRFRIKNCQPEFDIFTDVVTGKKKMILKTGVILDESQIAERFK
ncbi:membrane protein insertion efficiency factor YidD [Aggregatimonas sangjinii]|uniref:Membrane protein insertion efficiency factor YidD n=1 Tax=Aggregatimonas sangjinii TaxID=2583587 RepID=A0A5B7SRA6_9FLAO|nr:membrane protein insertion efficiency factor YidD [Aggregatimonas sangjinii]QCX00762.1 membrane protein insertion efficiency factor YidD [Aggregatimonas sangjinii]